MPKPRHKVHEVDEDVLLGVWTEKSTNRGVKISHTGIPGVQGPPSPSKRTSSPVKPPADRSYGAANDEFDDYDMFDGTEPLRRGKVRSFVIIGAIDSSMTTQSQNDYLREFEERSASYLDILMQSYGLPPDVRCRGCGGEGWWRCRDCFGGALWCRGCCRCIHLTQPLHRVERWNGRFFERSALWEVGVRLYLGHQGHPCPSADSNTSVWNDEQDRLDRSPMTLDPTSDLDEWLPTERVTAASAAAAASGHPGYNDVDERVWNNPPDEEDWDELDDQIEDISGPTKQIPTEDFLGGRFLTIVDSSGIHHLSALYCSCSGPPCEDQQLLAASFFPASFSTVSTVFTFHVLDDFRRDNLECKTTPYQFYQKIRRVTNSSFPQLVPNRYQELRRASRAWRQLKKWKWHGIPYDASQRGPGAMAIFCAACPQPNVNLKPAWVTDKDK
jgi:CxC2 like cysteine cluster associated with KDZ transposases